ncbi:MAG: trypsin-like peptidase domain-containing protein [candidate division Zixibacteria bacterium]|nr:trypsin-like peptidase domain-containing protein [candidate division Zixibacteria bacterium]
MRRPVRTMITVGAIAMAAYVGFGASAPVAPPPVTTTDLKKVPAVIDGDPTGPMNLQERRDYVNRVYGTIRGQLETPATGNGVQVIYGTDDRKDIYDVTDPAVLAVANATCAVIDQSEITNNGNGTYTLSTTPWTTQNGFPLCVGERFAGQLELGFCTGFLVGSNILATAGHCINNSSDCLSSVFVFGFVQIDATTPPVTVVPAANVYFCSGIIDRQKFSDLDYCILHLDRTVTGRDPLPIRHSGTVSNADPLVVVGHGITLPMKAADGAEVKNANGTTAWFQANTDTYGGNSGSPILGLNSQLIEGILVRGATDFVTSGGCTRSNVVPNSGNTGGGLVFEEISKSTSFAAFVPELVFAKGKITLDRTSYACTGTAQIELRDLDLKNSGAHTVSAGTSGGDLESVNLTESPANSGIFVGTIPIAPGGASGGNGTLDVAHGQTITATYNDADDGTGQPAVATDNAAVDCVGPVITNVNTPVIGGVQASIAFDTDEPSSALVHYGTSCGALLQTATGPGGVTSHLTPVGGLRQQTQYFYSVEATDAAGNTSAQDNGGACYTFTTTSRPDYFTELFSAGDNDLNFKTITFTPDATADFYAACTDPAAAFPTDPSGGTSMNLADDASSLVSLSGGAHVSLYGVSYTSFYVGSNGYITFGGGDTDWDETLAKHFSPRPRISALYDDLAPPTGGTISRKQLADRAVVTWQNVPEFTTDITGDTNSFQIEMFFDGKIAITFLRIDAHDGLTGLSRGNGLPGDFAESDLSAYGHADADSDGVCDAGDNCPYFANPDQIGCPFHGDPVADGVTDVLDVVAVVGIAFRGSAAIIDSTCPHAPGGRTDVDCNGVTDILDVVLFIDVAFRGTTRNFCHPCACNPYPTNCP